MIPAWNSILRGKQSTLSKRSIHGALGEGGTIRKGDGWEVIKRGYPDRIQEFCGLTTFYTYKYIHMIILYWWQLLVVVVVT